MSRLTVTYHSKALSRPTTFEMLIPNDSDSSQTEQCHIKALFLLHGYNCGAFNWVPEYLCEKYSFAVICPNGENSFWLDGISTGHRFATLLGEELPDYIRKTFGIALNREDTHIMGFSMGGFGALHTALAYPDVYSKCAALSSALIVHEVAGMLPGSHNGVANYEYYRECVGEPSQVLSSRANPETLVDEILAKGGNMPEIFMACGTEDFLIENNREFHAFLESRSVKHMYFESPGIHDMPFWQEYAVKAADWMFCK